MALFENLIVAHLIKNSTVLWNRNVLHSQLNAVHNLTPYFFKISFNNILLSTFAYAMCSPHFMFPD
jgi:hypothetical protein